MRRLIAPVLLVTVVGLAVPPAITQAQSAATAAPHEGERSWSQAQGEAKARWGKLTDDDIQQLDGRREVLIGKLQIRYAISHEEAEREVGDFEARQP